MKLHPPRTFLSNRIALGAVATVWAIGMSVGSVGASSEPPDVAPTGDPSAPGCPEVTALLDSVDGFTSAFLNDDGEAIAAIFAALPDQSAAAEAAAPPEIAAAVSAFVAEVPIVLDALEGVDLTDIDAITFALSSLPPDEAGEDADVAIREWAGTTCAWESSLDVGDMFADAPEPPECEILDPATAAAAAGIDVDVSDSDGGGDFSLPGYWTKSCSYGNGAMSLSTISFNSIEQATQFFVDNMDDGEFLDVDLGSLPASTLVTVQADLLSVAVLEATVPFSVGFHADEVTPEAAVAAAEAVLASLPADVPMPGSSESP